MPAIRRALISVYDKTGLEPLARALASAGVELVSTGGTAKRLVSLGLEVKEVQDLTGFPEILEGRVKTLHPGIHAGLLADRRKPEHVATLSEQGIEPFDLLVSNLYPFAETLAQSEDFEVLIEQIDIGGPAMLRAAAKNMANLSVLCDPADYADFIRRVESGNRPDAHLRQRLAAKVFAHTAAYDSLIASWLNGQNTQEALPRETSLGGQLASPLRYGENPHQAPAGLYLNGGQTGPSAARAELKQGKALSYNNLLDADAALNLVSEFSEPAVALIKHNNPCGVAQHSDLATAYDRALACDPLSAFGGIVALNRPLSLELAEQVSRIFTEVLIAPSADPEALAFLTRKPNLRVLITGGLSKPSGLTLRPIQGGFLLQPEDSKPLDPLALETVTQAQPNTEQLADLVFAHKVAKHTRSNAIVYAREGATLGIGAGQMSRIDSCLIAALKAERAGLDLKGSVLASDAFFPFADGLDAAVEAGASAIIQPGGAQRDAEVIAAADQAEMVMLFSGQRHFKH